MKQEYKPMAMNLELTTCCPLHCPQCYCTLEGGKHLDFEIAKRRVREAGEMGVKILQLSGGETMCYPHLFELVEYASKHIAMVNVALSGYHVDESVVSRLVEAGVGGIFVSLNGSTEEINALTRDGYDLALHALQVLKDSGFENTFINWVMHSHNAEDFMNVVRIAEEYGVKHLVVLSFKPDSHHELKSFPSAAQMYRLAEEIKAYRGPVKLSVESCFSQLLAIILDTKLFGNLNVGLTKGCRAGLCNLSVNVEGRFSPCRHLDYFEDFDTMEDYWNNSEILKKLRMVENDVREPCNVCRYKENCRPCMAVTSKLHGEPYIGHDVCGVWNTSRT